MSEFFRSGLAAAHARRPAEALAWFERAVAADPADTQARAWLGQSLCAVGRRLEGVEALRRAGEDLLEHGDLEKVCTIIGQLHGWGDFPGALVLARSAAARAPENLQVQHLLAITCGQLNLTDEALAAVETAEAMAPGAPMLQVFRASLEADAKRFESARSRLEHVLAHSPAPREAHRAHKELARVLDALGDYAGAFAHLDAAAPLAQGLPEFQRLDLRFIPAMVAANRQGFTSQLMGRWRAHAFEDPAPVFLLGFFRSGTTLAQQVLAVHPDVFVADEAGLLEDIKRELHALVPGMGNVHNKLDRLDAAGVAQLRSAYWRAARGRYGEALEGRTLVDKFTLNTIDLGLINTIFPDGKVVFAQRDPRDVCISCYMQLMPPSSATRHLQDWEGTAQFYALVMDWWLFIRPRLTIPVFELRYEAGVADFEGTFRAAFEFLGLDWPEDAETFYRNARGRFIASPSRNQVSQPIYGSSVARWRRYEAQVERIADRLAPFVQAFGYA
jgi:tetratricopeptide (TPR) repeat protein